MIKICRSYILDTLKNLQMSAIKKNEFYEGYYFGRLSIISELASFHDRKLAEKYVKMYCLEFDNFINIDFSKYY